MPQARIAFVQNPSTRAAGLARLRESDFGAGERTSDFRPLLPRSDNPCAGFDIANKSACEYAVSKMHVAKFDGIWPYLTPSHCSSSQHVKRERGLTCARNSL